MTRTSKALVLSQDDFSTNPGQIALALFEDLAPKDSRIDQAPTEIGYQRADFFLDIDGMSLAGRRAIDVAYFLVAQSEHCEPNPYYARHTQGEFTTYVVDLEFFKWLMAYNSNNRNHLRSVLRQGQKAAVEVIVTRDVLLNGSVASEGFSDISPEIRNKYKTNGKRTLGKDQSWVSVPLMGAVGIDRNQIYFKVHAQLEPYIKSPLRSHFLDLRLLFKTLRGRILYDRIQAYVEVGLTPWFEVNWLRKVMDCNTKAHQEFKYFNSRALSTAIDDINTNTNLHVKMQTALEAGTSRQVKEVRFLISQRNDRVLPASDERLHELQERYRIMVDEFGLNREQIHKITKNRAEWTDERIDKAIEYTRFQIKQGKVKRSVAGYFMKALEEHYVLGSATKLLFDSSFTPSSEPINRPPTKKDQVVSTYQQQLNMEWEQVRNQQSRIGEQILHDLLPKIRLEYQTRFYTDPVARFACSKQGLRLAEVCKSDLTEDHPLWLDFCAYVGELISSPA